MRRRSVYVCIPTIRKFDLARKCVDSALRGTRSPNHIIVLDNSGSLEILNHFRDIMYPRYNVHIVPKPDNLGVAGSWNFFFNTYGQSDTDLIIANDDIEFGEQTIEHLVSAADANPDKVLFHGPSKDNSFSMFLLRYKTYMNIGCFDETFFPAYFEDNDYARRIILAGKELTPVETATFSHVGSATLHTYNQAELMNHHEQFRRNRQYYKEKWGNIPGQETYTTPFNSGIESKEWHALNMRKC